MPSLHSKNTGIKRTPWTVRKNFCLYQCVIFCTIDWEILDTYELLLNIAGMASSLLLSVLELTASEALTNIIKTNGKENKSHTIALNV